MELYRPDLAREVATKLSGMESEFSRVELKIELAYLRIYKLAKGAELLRTRNQNGLTGEDKKLLVKYTSPEVPEILLGSDIPTNSGVFVYNPYTSSPEDLSAHFSKVNICWNHANNRANIVNNLYIDSRLGGSFALFNYNNSLPTVYTRNLVVLHEDNLVLFYDTVEGGSNDWETLANWTENEKGYELLLSILATFSLARRLGIKYVALGEKEGREFAKYYTLHADQFFAGVSNETKIGLKPSTSGEDGVRIQNYRKDFYHGRFHIMEVVSISEEDTVETIEQAFKGITNKTRSKKRINDLISIFKSHSALYRHMTYNGFDNGFLEDLDSLESRIAEIEAGIMVISS